MRQKGDLDVIPSLSTNPSIGVPVKSHALHVLDVTCLVRYILMAGGMVLIVIATLVVAVFVRRR